MERANWRPFQILTKRSSRLRDFRKARYAPSRGPTHMGLGVSLEDRSQLSRVRHLRESPAGMRFLSIEPLIGRIGRNSNPHPRSGGGGPRSGGGGA